MSWQVKLVALAIAAALLGIVFELVRTRRLREEYSVLWFLTGITIVLMTVFFEVLVWLTRLLGSVYPSSIFFFFALVFLMAISLHYAIRVSRLTSQLKNLAQKVALLEHATRDRVLDEASTR
ncbi:MAG: DUF2304 domain-containing protein [bacterium]|nr:DUF2304 domain-containing protein [bacterium]